MRPGKQRSRTPASFYHPSPRPCPERLPPLEYPGRYEVRRVSRNGGIRWKKGWVNISPSIIEQNVGLEEIDDGVWSLYFGSVLLGRFHENDLTLHGSSTHLRGHGERPMDACGNRFAITRSRPQAYYYYYYYYALEKGERTRNPKTYLPPRCVDPVLGLFCKPSPRLLTTRRG